MNRNVPLLGAACAVVAALVIVAAHRLPAKPHTPIPSLPTMTTMGLGILVGGIVIGSLIYLWKRPS